MRERCIYGFVGETWGERKNLEELGMHGRILLNSNLGNWLGT
jgi:hypothetical protein